MNHQYEDALDPEQLARFFVARANQGDVEGIVALYEPDAVLACPDGSIAKGSAEIREFMLNCWRIALSLHQVTNDAHFDMAIWRSPRLG